MNLFRRLGSWRVAAAALLLAILILLPSATSLSEPPTITLALLGDVMLGRGVMQARLIRGWEGCFSSLSPMLQSADLALANLESPLATSSYATTPGMGISSLVSSPEVTEGLPMDVTPATDKDYNLCAPPESTQALTAVGLDILTLANNHTHDCLAGNAQVTASVLNSHGLAAVLPGDTLHLTVQGISIAILAFDDVSSSLDLETVAESIAAAGEDGSQVVVSIHWGSEYHPGPDQRQRQLAEAMAQAGAALIWGHHPHVLQGVEWLPRGGHDSPSLVIYSAGNALFDQITPPDANRSAVLWVTLDADGVRGVEAKPFEIDALNGETRSASPDHSTLILQRLNLPGR